MFAMRTVSEYFGSLVFDDREMRAALTAEVYASLRKTIDEGRKLDITVANAVAFAMKDWALSKGATHFTHWFQPLTGITAEKHDSFIMPAAGRRSHHGVFRKGIDQRRTGCFLVSVRRIKSYV